MAPFEVLYERRFRSLVSWLEVGENIMIGPDMVIEAIEKFQLIRERLKAAQNRQKSYTDAGKRDLEFKVNILVYLKVSLMKWVKIFGKKGKLNPRYVGPYRISSHMGKVVYELRLTADLSSVHPVFYVSLLKKFMDNSTILDPLENAGIQNSLLYKELLVEILNHQIGRLRNKEVPLVKVVWQNQSVEGSTWET